MSTLARRQRPSAIGTLAAPCTLGATASATDVLTFTHNFNEKASQVLIVDSSTGALLATVTDVTVSQTVNAITITNTAAGARSIIAQLRWEDEAVQLNKPVPASGSNQDARIVYS